MEGYKGLTDNDSCTYDEEGTYKDFINHITGEGDVPKIVPPEVENQGDDEICWALAPAKLAETAFLKAGKEHKRVSIRHIIDSSYPTGMASGGGGQPAVALEFLRTSGVYLEADYEKSSISTEAEKRAIDNWYPVRDNEEDIFAALKKNVLVITVPNWNAFSSLKGKGLLDMKNAESIHLENNKGPKPHSLLLVGAGTFVPKNAPHLSINYWIVKNSWSNEWGIDGLGYIIRDSTLDSIHSSKVYTKYSPYFAYVRGQGLADPDFKSIVESGISVEDLVKWLNEFKDHYLLFFFYDRVKCEELRIVPDELMTAVSKIFLGWSSELKMALIDVSKETNAIGRFKLQLDAKPAAFLVYLDCLGEKRQISDARSYDGSFNFGDIMLWSERTIKDYYTELMASDDEASVGKVDDAYLWEEFEED